MVRGMVEFTLPVLLQIVQTVGILVGIVYYLIIMRNSQINQELALRAQEQALETRQAQLFMSIYGRANEVEFWENFNEVRQWEWKSFEEYEEKYGSNPKMRAKFGSLGTFFEGMGVMVKRGLIDVTVVDDLLSGPIMGLWQKHESIILEDRRRRSMPTMWEWFEYLYEEVRKVAEVEHGAEHVADVVRLHRLSESRKER
jgi:hypothetical protein